MEMLPICPGEIAHKLNQFVNTFPGKSIVNRSPAPTDGTVPFEAIKSLRGGLNDKLCL